MTTIMAESRQAIDVERRDLGRASLRQLDWDTDFFRARMGAVDELLPAPGASDRAAAVAALLGELLEGAADEGYAHIMLRLPGHDWAAVHGAERAGFHLVDVALDFAYRFEPEKELCLEVNPAVRAVRDEDVPSLGELGAEAFTFSRFVNDPFFSRAQVQDFHRRWVTNLCGGLAQAVLVYEVDGRIAGFVSCTLDGKSGRIPLTGTAAGYRRQGIGKALVDAALGWFREQTCETAYVKTQADNIPAVALYQRAGFFVDRTEMTLTKTLERSPAEEEATL